MATGTSSTAPGTQRALITANSGRLILNNLTLGLNGSGNDPSDAVSFAEQSEENMFRADISMIECFGFLCRERENFFHPRSIRDIANHLLIGAGADLFLDFHADGFEVESHLLKDIDRDALSQLNQPEQEMLGADEVVVKSISFLSREC